MAKSEKTIQQKLEIDKKNKGGNKLHNSFTNFLRRTITDYESLNDQHTDWMKEITREYSIFKERKQTKSGKVDKSVWNEGEKFHNGFKVNRVFEAVTKTTPFIMNQLPKINVSPETEFISQEDILKSRKILTELGLLEDQDQTSVIITEEAKVRITEKRMQLMREFSDLTRDLLDSMIIRSKLLDKLITWAKDGLIYGNSFVESGVNYKKKGKGKVGNIMDNVLEQRLDIKHLHWSDVLYDPRYMEIEDMPNFITIAHQVRLEDIKGNDEYINTDMLEGLVGNNDSAGENRREDTLAILGISNTETSEENDKTSNKFNVYKYNGIYDFGDGEKLYKISVAAANIVIKIEEIDFLPIIGFKCINDTNIYHANGIAGPMVPHQQELNFYKTNKAEYVQNATKRRFYHNPLRSGLRPDLNLNNPKHTILYTNKDVEKAKANYQEVDFKPLQADVWAQTRETETDAQKAGYQVDLVNPAGTEALTNLATGIRVAVNQTANVINLIKKNFESALRELMYIWLEQMYRNAKGNLDFKRLGDEKFATVHKDLIRDALLRYDIKIEPGSSGVEFQTEKLNNTITQWNISTQASGLGVPVDLTKIYVKLMDQFPNTDGEEFLKTDLAPAGEPTGAPVGGDIKTEEAPKANNLSLLPGSQGVLN